MTYILTITDLHGTREEPYATREQAERAVRVLRDQGSEAALRPMTRFEAGKAMTAARMRFGMMSPEAIAAERALIEVEREWNASRRDTRDPVLRHFQD